MIEDPKLFWRVFAQGDEPRLSKGDWTRHGDRFFGVKIAFLDDRVVVDGASRIVCGRAREEKDLRDALQAPGAADNGLYDLAERRCKSIWIVERQNQNDRIALTLAAIIASVCLGPILGDENLFGVRTAREKLASLSGM